jgi:acetyl esterase/lipase
MNPRKGWWLAGLMLAALGAHAQDEPRSGADPAGDYAEEFGGATCADRDRQVRRILASPFVARIAYGPAPDRKDVAYGSQPRERLDVYLPRQRAATPAPVIVMVHGGGWCVGDKALRGVTENKIAHWVPMGFVFVSVAYPMIGDGSRALQQAASIARAVAYVQAHAGDWGGDGKRLVLMGHSAGAHLVSLVNADARLRAQYGVRPVLGVISLDSGATDVVTEMRRPLPMLAGRYREAFGTTESAWAAASPYQQLDRTAAPWMGVCSTRRPDDSCGQARAYADKSKALGIAATVEPVDKTHGAINHDLGLPSQYTHDVDRFLATLDPQVRTQLAH